MRAPVLLVVTNGGRAPAPLSQMVARGLVEVVEQTLLDNAALEEAEGLITAMHLDQIDFAERAPSIEKFLSRGGRLAFMGHVVRPFLSGLKAFVPLTSRKRADFSLTALADHPVFAGAPRPPLETRRGVAGFYGRGHVPLPPGARALTGLGPNLLPVDWAWDLPAGGSIFLHAGNDIWGVSDSAETNQGFADRIVAWCSGGGGAHQSQKEAS